MACKCDPGRQPDDECPCKNAPPFPGGSPRRALNPEVCPRGFKCGTGLQETAPPYFGEPVERYDYNVGIPRVHEEPAARWEDDDLLPCISLEPQRRAPCAKPIGHRPRKPICPSAVPEPPPTPPPCMGSPDKHQGEQKPKPLRKKKSAKIKERCRGSEEVSLPCGAFPEDSHSGGAKRFNRLSALEKTVSRTEWYDEEGYHSATVSLSQLYRPDEQAASKPCSSDRRRNYLRAKLKELLLETRQVPESIFPGNVEAKPEPEVIAGALFMSEREGADLGRVKPDNVFNKLFAQSSTARSVSIASAGPQLPDDLVIPLIAEGQQSNTLMDVPNMNRIVENTRSVVPPNPNVFQQSQGYESNATQGRSTSEQENVLEYVINAELPAYRNCIRLNGSAKPCWFPGYMLVFPQLPEIIRMTSDPGDALHEGWHLCRPRHFHQYTKFLLNTE